MAKSLRSKSKRSFRRIKRDDPKSDYHIRDKLRLQRLNEKLKVLTPVSDDEEEVEENGDDEEAVMQADADVDVDAAAGGASKVGTSTSKGKGKGKKVEQGESKRAALGLQWCYPVSCAAAGAAVNGSCTRSWPCQDADYFSLATAVSKNDVMDTLQTRHSALSNLLTVNLHSFILFC
jgi:hypothetical protein